MSSAEFYFRERTMTKPEPQPVTRETLEQDLEHLVDEQEMLRRDLQGQMWELGRRIREIRNLLREM